MKPLSYDISESEFLVVSQTEIRGAI
jgi:hypothetical protein